MTRRARGISEVFGLGSGVAAADAALKAANVHLIGYELSGNNGAAVIKLEGDVGAVTAAVEAGKAAARLGRGYTSALVIPRPSENLDLMIHNDETVGSAPPKNTPPAGPAPNKVPATKPATGELPADEPEPAPAEESATGEMPDAEAKPAEEPAPGEAPAAAKPGRKPQGRTGAGRKPKPKAENIPEEEKT